MPEFELTIKAELISPISVIPKRVYFIGKKEEILKTEVEIKANMDKPLILRVVDFDLGEEISYKIKEIKKRRVYKIYLTKYPVKERRIKGVLKIKTNYPEMPFIKLQIRGYFR